jgi:hypothetical protein
MDLEALAIAVRDLEEEGFLEPEPQAIEGGEVDVIVEGGGRLEEPPDLLHAEDGGEPVGGVRAQERQCGAVTLQDVLREEAEATVAEAHGRGGEPIDVFPMQEIALQLLFGDTVGGFVVERSEQVDFSDIGCLRPFAFAAEVASCDHFST